MLCYKKLLFHRPGGTPTPLEKLAQNSSLVKENPSNFIPIGKNGLLTIPTVKFWSEFAVPTGFFGLKTMKINIPSYKIKGIFIPTGIFVLNFIPAGYEISTGSVRQGLSLIHISEPTRPRLISYAVFCLKKKNNEFSFSDYLVITRFSFLFIVHRGVSLTRWKFHSQQG